MRPYRLYNNNANKFIARRCFQILRNAHNSAEIEASWSKIGTTIEVVDVRGNWHTVGRYTRRINGMQIWRKSHA